MTDYDFASDLMTPDPSIVKRNKKRINELLNKYGSGDAIRQNADLKDSIDYDFVHGDELIDEVLTERANSQNSPQLQNPLLQTNQAALAREARAVRTAYHHDEDKSDTVNAIKSDDNEYTGIKSDAVAPDKNTSDYQLGTLSSKYESLKNPAAIGYDNGGGHSYGVFQIETKHGTMKDFLSYLAQNKKYQSFEQKLQSSGGYAGALNKADNFVSAWKELAKNQDFIQSQYQFIFDMKFKPLLRNVAKIEGFDIEKRHPIVKDVLFSIAVQHGQEGALKVIRNALGSSAKNLDDESLINKLYDERSKVDKYLSTQPSSLRKNAKNNRYPNERKDALKALKE